MLFYSNRTKHRAILTIKIESTEDPAAAFMVGNDEFFEKDGVKLGYIDVIVESGKEFHLIGNTIATFVAVRTAP